MTSALSWIINPKETLAKAGGAVGKAIDVVGGALDNPFPNANISESLQSWGGNPNMPFVRVANAAENTTNDNYSLVPEGAGVTNPYSQVPTGGGVPGVVNNPNPNPNPNPDSGGPSEYDVMRNNWTNQVNNTYDPLISYLDKLAGTLPGWKEEKLASINDLFSSQTEELESQKEDQFNKLAANKQEVKDDERVNMKSLGENFRNWLQTGQNQLGVWGAGDSSASGMYKFALAKQVAKRGTDIARQVAKSINDIKMKEADVQSAFNTAKRELDRWLTTNTQQVKDWFNEKKQAIDTQKATAIGEKANALAQAEMSLMQDAYNKLQSIQSKAEEYDSKMKDWAINTMTSLNEYKVQMGQMGQYTPQEIAYQNLQGANQIMANTGGENPYWNIYGTAKKKFAEDWG